VDTEEGDFFFQDYFVKLSCKPVFTGVHFKGMEQAVPAPGFASALSNPALEAVIICPSNPFISIEPILSVPGIRKTLKNLQVPVVAVSPIIGNKSIKGPAAKMLAETGFPVSPLGIVKFYGEKIDGILIDQLDAHLEKDIVKEGVQVLVTKTLMSSTSDEKLLAEDTLKFTNQLKNRSEKR
jgi:LPPG:FO 2-phospho-L-lactate transferase